LSDSKFSQSLQFKVTNTAAVPATLLNALAAISK
jgi:hypothetical protein